MNMKLTDNIQFINEIEYLKLPNSRRFHISTNIGDFNKFKKTPRKEWPESWKKTHYKSYIRFPSVELPIPDKQDWSLQQTLIDRESTRKFIPTPIDMKTISSLLYFSAGQKSLVKNVDTTRRFYPSGGARYPIEIYPFILRSNKSIKKGVYHYHLPSHSLETIRQTYLLKEVWGQFNQPWIKNGSLLLVFTAIFDRTEEKYGNRGYRHILTEYGHIAQNIYLVGTALGLGICSIGGFNDNGINEILDLDGIHESVIGTIIVGIKK